MRAIVRVARHTVIMLHVGERSKAARSLFRVPFRV